MVLITVPQRMVLEFAPLSNEWPNITLNSLHYLIGPPDSPKTLKRIKTLDKSLPNHQFHSNFDLQKHQNFF